jgi:hypothetical protein
LTDRDVSEWNVNSKTWGIVTGEYMVHVGSSSQDIRLFGSFQVLS